MLKNEDNILKKHIIVVKWRDFEAKYVKFVDSESKTQ